MTHAYGGETWSMKGENELGLHWAKMRKIKMDVCCEIKEINYLALN